MDRLKPLARASIGTPPGGTGRSKQQRYVYGDLVWALGLPRLKTIEAEQIRGGRN